MKQNQTSNTDVNVMQEMCFYNPSERSIIIGDNKTQITIKGLREYKPTTPEEQRVCVEYSAKYGDTALKNITGFAVVIEGQGLYATEISKLKTENLSLTAEVESLKKQLNEVANKNIELISQRAVDKANTKKENSNS